ncbi:hypothetical protein DFP90_11458 [Aestuariispira insulae]|uniref:Uncharacterized protein n=1 Tax=Aestuariispira insulae TaxID=1461337 RepID=A0A3D9H6X4_9PROT|nr:hypothetical protein DFP90_11458 [Aestuariispira insulae]
MGGWREAFRRIELEVFKSIKESCCIRAATGCSFRSMPVRATAFAKIGCEWRLVVLCGFSLRFPMFQIRLFLEISDKAAAEIQIGMRVNLIKFIILKSRKNELSFVGFMLKLRRRNSNAGAMRLCCVLGTGL